MCLCGSIAWSILQKPHRKHTCSRICAEHPTCTPEKMPSHHLQSAEEQRPPPGAHDSHHDGQTADSLTESWGHGGWRAGFISASQRAWTRTCLGGHREVQISPSHSLCRTDSVGLTSSGTCPWWSPPTSFSSVQFSHSVVSDSLWPHGLQHARPPYHQLPEFTQTHVHWVCDAIQPSHPLSSPFSSCLQTFPASGSFQMSQFFSSGGQSIGVSASVLPMSIQDWFPLGLTGWISLQFKGPSRVFSNTTVQKHQFFDARLSL